MFAIRGELSDDAFVADCLQLIDSDGDGKVLHRTALHCTALQ